MTHRLVDDSRAGLLFFPFYIPFSYSYVLLIIMMLLLLYYFLSLSLFNRCVVVDYGDVTDIIVAKEGNESRYPLPHPKSS